MLKNIDCRLKINKSKKSCINKKKTTKKSNKPKKSIKKSTKKSNKPKKSIKKSTKKSNKPKKSTKKSYKKKSTKKSNKPKKSTKKSNLDKHIGKVIFVKLPNNNRYRWRWITRKNDKGRYYARAPKIGVLIRNLDLKRDSDYNKETILPINITLLK